MFLSNQKDILFQGIQSYIKRYKIKSVLDIGAGDGVLASKIFDIVDSYTALEKESAKCKKLSDKGLNVIEGEFPHVVLNHTYDLVLSSHSIPEDVEMVDAFVSSAWNYVRKGGVFLIVTFKGGKGDLYKFKKDIEGKAKIFDEAIFHVLQKSVGKLGEYTIQKKKSILKSDSLEDITKEMMLGLGYKGANKRKIVELYVKKHQIISDGFYGIKSEHLFICLQKI